MGTQRDLDQLAARARPVLLDQPVNDAQVVRPDLSRHLDLRAGLPRLGPAEHPHRGRHGLCVVQKGAELVQLRFDGVEDHLGVSLGLLTRGVAQPLRKIERQVEHGLTPRGARSGTAAGSGLLGG